MSDFTNKLKQYGALSASVLIAGTKVAKSQIIYTDLVPDVVVGSNGTISIDLDQDTIDDLDLEQYYYYYFYYYYNYYFSFTQNEVKATNHLSADLKAFGAFTNRADRMASGEMVEPSATYASSATVFLGINNSASYDWSNGAPHADQYLGVELDKGTHKLYGWIRLNFNANSTGFTVKDFAFNSRPGAAIEAGDNVMGMTVVDTTIALDENPTAGASLGTIKAFSSGSGPITFSIVNGNTGNAFLIEAATGELKVDNPSAVDFETTPIFNLEIEGTDGTYTDTALVTINLNDIDEPPVMNNQNFSIAENSPNGTSVGTVVAMDEGALTFSITAGNTGNTFAIDAASGEISVSDSTLLDFETNPGFNLTVRAEDGGGQQTDATVVINVTDVVEVGIAEREELKFEVYPNPTAANQPLTIEFPSADRLTVRVVDANGKLIDTFQNVRKKLVVDTRDWSRGIYFISAEGNGSSGTQRIVIQ